MLFGAVLGRLLKVEGGGSLNNVKALSVRAASKQARWQEWLGSVGQRGIFWSLSFSGWLTLKWWYQKSNFSVGNSEYHRTVYLTVSVEFLIGKAAKLPWKCRSLHTRRSNIWETAYGSEVFLKPQSQNTQRFLHIPEKDQWFITFI